MRRLLRLLATTKCDIAIVGAGPGGLVAATALRLALPGVDVQVFEKTHAFREAGSVINLGVNGVKALAALDPSGALLSAVQAAKAPPTSAALWNIEGKEVRRMIEKDMDQANIDKYGVASQRMAWFDYQNALRSQLPADIIHTDHVFTKYTDDAERDRVTVTFRTPHAEDEFTDVECRLLLGCDGVYSQVRRQLTQASEQLQSTNRVRFRAVARRDDWERHLPFGELVSDHVLIYTLGGPQGACLHALFNDLVMMNALFPVQVLEELGIHVEYNDQDLHVYLLSGDEDGDDEDEDEDEEEDDDDDDKDDGKIDTRARPEDVQKALLRALTPFHQQLQSVAKGIPALNVAVDNDYVCIDPAEAMWSRGRVALLGDAMHTLPAVGIGLAVEDALVLARALGEAGAPTPDVLGKYTEARRPRIKRVYDMFMDSMEGMMVNGLTAQNTNFLRGKEQLKEASSGSSGGGATPIAGPSSTPTPPPTTSTSTSTSTMSSAAASEGDSKAAGPPPGPGGAAGPAPQVQMFEVMANQYLAECAWKPLQPSRARVVTLD